MPFGEIASVLSPIVAYYKAERSNGESFGDFCFRKGEADLLAYAESFAGSAA